MGEADELAAGYAFGIALERFDRFSGEKMGPGDASGMLFRPAIGIFENDRAGVTNAFPAAHARAGEVEIFVQKILHHHVVGDVDRADLLSVDSERERPRGHDSAPRILSGVIGIS